MSIYFVLVLFGGVGFAAAAFMGVLGSVHHVSHHLGGQHAGAAHAQHFPGHGGASHGGHHTAAQHGHSHAQHHRGDHVDSNPTGTNWWSYLNPLDIFAYAIGVGMTGLLLQHVLANSALYFALAAGAIIFCWAIVKPLMGVLMKFASNPSEGLESMVSKPCEAASNFDSNGRGLVKMTIDGEIIQLLGILDSTELESLGSVLVGDRLLIVQIDSKRNQCRVIKTADASEAATVKSSA